jgi:hypothetical protein
VLHLLVIDNAVQTSLNLRIMNTEDVRSTAMTVLTGRTWHRIPEDGILHNNSRENLTS